MDRIVSWWLATDGVARRAFPLPTGRLGDATDTGPTDAQEASNPWIEARRAIQ